MPSSTVRTFTDPDEYATSLPHASVDVTVKERGAFRAKLCSIKLHQLWIQSLSEELARTSSCELTAGRAFLALQTQPGPAIVRDGVELSTTSIARLRQDFFQHTSGPASLTAMSLPVEAMNDIGASIAGSDLEPPAEHLTVAPSLKAMERLQRLQATAGTLAEYAPEIIAHPEAARGLEQALIESMMDCLNDCASDTDSAAQRQHAAIMRRFHRIIDEHLDEPLYIPELCKEIATSLRTLNACCQEHLGMGPKHYLLLRRMNLFRRALRRGSPSEITVTETATRYGFWQFGRLAVEYKALFGEAPSATLARPV